MELDVGRCLRLLVLATELLRRREGGPLTSRSIVAVLRATLFLGTGLVATGLRVSPALVCQLSDKRSTVRRACRAYEGELVRRVLVDHDLELVSAADTGEDGVIAVAAREGHLCERRDVSRCVPVLSRVEIGAVEDDVELRLVLDCALDPAVLVGEPGGRGRDHLLCDLSSVMLVLRN